jgi:hypothetical protein
LCSRAPLMMMLFTPRAAQALGFSPLAVPELP